MCSSLLPPAGDLLASGPNAPINKHRKPKAATKGRDSFAHRGPGGSAPCHSDPSRGRRGGRRGGSLALATETSILQHSCWQRHAGRAAGPGSGPGMGEVERGHLQAIPLPARSRLGLLICFLIVPDGSCCQVQGREVISLSITSPQMVKSGQVRSGQVRSGPVRSGQVYYSVEV